MGDGGEEPLLVLPLEGWLAHHHLVQQHPIGPPVHSLPVWLVVNYLWGNIVRGPTKCFCCSSINNAFLAQSEVCNLDVPLLVDHDVVQLEVPVDDPVAVKEEDTDSNLSCIKSEKSESEQISLLVQPTLLVAP